MTEFSQNPVLANWNQLDAEPAEREILSCCGSRTWSRRLAAQRPFYQTQQLLQASDCTWASLSEEDWKEAFDSHPRIGQRCAPAATAGSLAWSSEEQRSAIPTDEAIQLALAEGNRQYEIRFGRIFIVCASGRSASEILAILNSRMNKSATEEWREAGEQQRQITQLRLRRWLEGN